MEQAPQFVLDLARLAADTPPADLPRLLARLRECEALVLARLCAGSQRPELGAAPERLLTVQEVAERLSCSVDWLYRHAKQLPFCRRTGFGLRFSESALNAYIRGGRR